MTKVFTMMLGLVEFLRIGEVTFIIGAVMCGDIVVFEECHILFGRKDRLHILKILLLGCHTVFTRFLTVITLFLIFLCTEVFELRLLCVGKIEAVEGAGTVIGTCAGSVSVASDGGSALIGSAGRRLLSESGE